MYLNAGLTFLYFASSWFCTGMLFVFSNYYSVVSDKLDAVSGYRVCEMEVYRKLSKALKLFVSSFVRKSGSMLRS